MACRYPPHERSAFNSLTVAQSRCLVFKLTRLLHLKANEMVMIPPMYSRLFHSSVDYRTTRWSLLLPLLCLLGCGGPAHVATVQGTVTLGGQPLADATVTFVAQATGAISRGRTDTAGRYRLLYSHQYEGAEIGRYRVTISTFRDGDPDADPPVPRSPENVPLRYNQKSDLVADVQAGTNQLDFALESGGPIFQPDLQRESPNG